MLDQSKYVETTKGIVKRFVRDNAGQEVDTTFAFPINISDQFTLVKPLIYVELENEWNTDRQRGKRDGRGGFHKRKMLRFSIQILTTGDAEASLNRDRIVQSLTAAFIEQFEFLAGEGLRESDVRYVGSYRLRERVNLARMEYFCEITLRN